ncbi:hypothetical protein HYU16_04330 [Candidatus Woesearchaeota archaeon]|nr:hypothetical protein [Candidatus Woesearchaeota archaeon]
MAVMALFLLLASIDVSAATYVAKLQASLEKSLYGTNEEMHLSGSVLLSNLSANDTSFLAVANSNASINFTLENASGIQAQHLLNTSGDGSFKSRSDNFPAGIQINAPAADGYYNFSVAYTDPNTDVWKVGGVVRVFGTSIDYISISPDFARYYAGDIVPVNLRALRYVGDKKVALANVSVNGSMRYTNRTVISTFSCTTNSGGVCLVKVTAPSQTGTYILEANNFLSTSSFVVVPFEAFVYVKDSTGESFKEILKANEVATVEAKVLFNGTTPTGDFVFNGTITDSSSNVIANITSTELNSNNSYTNRFSFTVSNAFTNGVYYVSVTVYKTGGSSVAASTSFQVRSWTLTVTKATKDSGFEYEYTAFANKNISFEVFPKESENGTVITGLNSTQFNITLTGKTGDVIAIGNSTWNSSCSSSGCYTFVLATPAAAGRYLLAVSLNYSSDAQTVHRIIGVTSTSLSALPSSQDGLLKEVFGTTEFVYVSLSAKNQTSAVNITDVFVESVVYENGTKFNFTEVNSWSDINSSNSALEWAWNASAQRIKLDAPKAGGDYLITVFANNRSAAASTKFGINPYSACSTAKNTAGSVDSSSSFYVWQYKTTDTVYFELKVSQAQNGLGKAAAPNGTFSSSYYGMGSACQLDTTKSQAITNATIEVTSVVNLQNGATASINTTASTCSADDNSGTYTCTVKPLTKWDGGRYAVKMQITGSDGETRDRAESIFEARAFYLWAYSNSWTNKPASNITFNVQLYEAGTNWWSNYGSTGGITGEVAVQKIEYNGKDGEWLWPPIDISYNTTGLNASNVTNGRGTFTLETSRLPKGRWEPGYYFATIKGTNTATGESDYGQAWFGIKQWDAYSTPVEQSGSSYAYKNSFSTKENATLYIRITNAGDWSDNGGTNLAGGEKLVVGVKKLQHYTTWPPTELNTSAYTVGKINVSTSSPWYYSANPNTHSKYVMNISPTSGRWNSGYYNVILDVNGTETGYGWFNVISFNVNTQPTNASGTYTYTTKGNGPVYFNITTTKNQKASYGNYGAADYINTTFKDLVLRTWLESTWQTVEYNYPEDLNVSPLQVNGTALLQVNVTGNWPAGYYWGEITMQDSENSTGTGYMWFSVRPFRVDTSTNQYTIDSDANVSVNLNVRQPDWSNNNLISGNYTVAQVYEDIWSGSGRTRTFYTNYFPANTSWFNATTLLNISPSTVWSSANNGYHYLTVVVRDNGDNTTQNGWVSFRAVPFSITVGSVFGNQYAISQSGNVTVPVTVRKAITNAATPANLSRVYEWTYPTQTEYGFAVGNCTSAANGTACQVNGTQNVTLVVPGSGWSSGWHYLYLEFVSPTGGSKLQADNSAWFNAVQAYDGYFSNWDEGGQYKYYFGFDENLTIRLFARNLNYIPQNVNVTKVEMSEDGDSCWSESCKTYSNHSYVILNGSGGNEIRGNGTIRIVKPSGSWKRGQHSIKATVQGSAGSAVIKGGYVYVKDTVLPNVTMVSPQVGAVVNATTFLFNATTNENSRCSVTLANYDHFLLMYCSGINGSAACNSSRFNGSTFYYKQVNYASGEVFTGGKTHHYTFNVAGLANQDYGLLADCYDIDWNVASGRSAFTLNVSQPHVPVTVNLSSPANNAVINNTGNVTFQYNITGPPGVNASCSVYINTSNMWQANATSSAITFNSTNTTIAKTNISGFNNGTYVWNTYCYQTTNTTNAAWAPANFTFTAAINSSASNASNTTYVPASVNLTSPANNSAVNTSTVTFNYNASGPSTGMTCALWSNSTGAWKVNVTNSSATQGQQTASHTNFVNGTYVWNARCEDNSNSSNYAFGAFNFTLSVVNLTGSASSSSNVTVNLSSPANSSIINTNMVPIFNVSGPSLLNCSVWGNFTGAWLSNITNNSISPGSINAGTLFLGTGYYIWNTRCVDATNNSAYAWAPYNWTFTRS